jgi:hypothetical protein
MNLDPTWSQVRAQVAEHGPLFARRIEKRLQTAEGEEGERLLRLIAMVRQVEDERAGVPRCQGCGCRLGMIEASRWGVCMPCTRARARAVGMRRCVCGRKARPVEKRGARRVWTACERCLGPM